MSVPMLTEEIFKEVQGHLTVTPMTVRTPVILKPRKVRLVTQKWTNTKRVDQSCFSPLTFPVTAVSVMKANTPEPPNQANQAEDRGEDLILCICEATEDNGGSLPTITNPPKQLKIPRQRL